MKKEFHPKYYKCNVICNCGENKGVLFTTRSTVPEIKVEICSQCHPFFTGTQKIVDTAGRVEKFNKRYGKKKTEEVKPEEVKAEEVVS
ncbi:MAG: 50S ribosomal protein L31 [bacterium]